MGDLRDWSPESNGAVTEHRPVLSSPSPSSSNPNLTAISAGIWEIAEQTTQEIVSHVQPSVVSEERRKEVIDYVQNLIRDCLGCEVFPFGSVPLKTYLPDGDIDLTAFGGINFEDALASDVRSVLEGEDQNRAARFVVKDVQLIHAEVKLVKCLVQNIVVDISFNQLGGLCTLCFLEEVDRLIGKDHLFKRSIILTKAWCYYESRILGAHHGLISTYALETLVLYIFHLFHSSLNGPLAVLYKFLDYFSKFDWDNYCISLNGPVRISSLPEIMVETPENGGVGLLLSNEFLRKSVEMYSVSSKGSDMSSRTFPQKHLNIVDPLKENNNLGRSVSKGNFYRIRSAFTYGARKLGRILSQPEENLADELQRFFSNALDRHGSGQRPDVQDPVPKHGYNGFGPASSFSGIEACQEDGSISESESTDLRGCLTEQGGLDAKESLHDRLNSANRAALEMELIRTINERQRGSMRVVPSTMLSEADSYAHGTAVSGNRLSGDAKDLATPRIQDLGITDDAPKSSPASIEEGISPLGKAYHAPHLYFSRSHIGNGKLRNESPDQDQPENFDFTDNKASSRLLQAPDAETGSIVHSDRDENQLVCNHKVLTSDGSKDDTSMLSPLACALEDFHPGYRERASVYSVGSPETLNFLSDLSGDYKSHLRSLQYGRWCCEYALNPPMSPPLLSQFQSKNSWDAIRWSAQFGQNVFSHMNANGVVPRQAFYLMSPPLSPVAAFGMEEKPKPRGTGTYFPNTNHYRDRHPRGRHHASMRSPRNNGRVATLSETNLIERSSRELSQAQIPVHQSGGKHVSSDFSQFGSPGGKAYPNANGSMLPPERVMEFGPLATQPLGVTLPESSRQPNPSSSLAQNSNLSLPAAGMQRPKLVLDLNQDRVAGRSYRLKDEDDFPPLSG